MANYDPNVITPSLATAPTMFSGNGQSGIGFAGAGAGAPHYGLVGLVLLAVLILFILDKAGFRFAVTVGRR